MYKEIIKYCEHERGRHQKSADSGYEDEKVIVGHYDKIIEFMKMFDDPKKIKIPVSQYEISEKLFFLSQTTIIDLKDIASFMVENYNVTAKEKNSD